MALNPLTQVTIALQAGSVSRAGFGIPLFAAAHRYFPERTRSYSNLLSATDDVPTGSVAYTGLSGFFSQNPTVTSAKLGRIEADQVLTPTGVEDGSVHSITVINGDGDAITASYTAGATDTAQDVCEGLKTAIDADPNVSASVTTAVNGTLADATLTLSAQTGETFYTPYDQITNLSDAYTYSEAAADVVSNIRAEDDDWYFITTQDHTEAFVLAMAVAIESTSKVYFVSSGEYSSLSTLASPPTDILGQLADAEYNRTIGLWHQDADEDYPETAFVGRNAPFDAGSVTWANIRLAGVTPSRNEQGNLLTGTQKNNLEARNTNFIEDYRSVNIVRLGRVTSGEYIDTIRGMDWLNEELTVALSNLLINQAGGKLEGNEQGRTRIINVIDSALQRGVNRNFIEPGYRLTVPSPANRSTADKAERILRGVTFNATLTGAIHTVEISGTLSL